MRGPANWKLGSPGPVRSGTFAATVLTEAALRMPGEAEAHLPHAPVPPPQPTTAETRRINADASAPLSIDADTSGPVGGAVANAAEGSRKASGSEARTDGGIGGLEMVSAGAGSPLPNSAKAAVLAPPPRRAMPRDAAAQAGVPVSLEAARNEDEVLQKGARPGAIPEGSPRAAAARRRRSLAAAAAASTTTEDPVAAPAVVGATTGGRLTLRRAVVLPHASAVAALMKAFAWRGDLGCAFELYRQVYLDRKAVARQVLEDRQMWETLIEACCRLKRTDLALEVQPSILKVWVLKVNAWSIWNLGLILSR